jgi:Domain of unknown function (DUF4314)
VTAPELAAGDRVEFLGFGEHDPYTDLRPGTLGTVDLVDDAGTVHVRWDNGSRLGMVTRPLGGRQPGFRPDRFRRVARS